jgi:NADPH-dependent 2,4-dienoyl-CoA reductase/sulfur reductase-like enzyme
VLTRSPVRVTLIDESRAPGGQIHRTPALGLQLDMRQVLGSGFAVYADFHTTAATVCGEVDYRPQTLAWSVHDKAVHLAAGSSLAAVGYDALVLATGATDRVMPAPGWTLPGVFTLGAAQVLLKDQGCLIGRRVVFCGSSPLLYLAALQYLRAGGEVAAVIDTTRFFSKVRALPDMLAAPRTLAEGLRYMRELGRRVPLIHGAASVGFDGDGRVSAVVYQVPGTSPERITCDAVAYGHGLRPESQLAELAGCQLRFDAIWRLHVPVIDADGRAGSGIYIAGDGGVIGGAEAAAVSGTLVGAAVLRDLGIPGTDVDLDALGRRLRRLRRFQRGMATAFAWPRQSAGALDDAVVLCRCENVRVGEVRAALRQPIGVDEANRVKAATRCGMGRCQGRFCGAGLAELTAASLGRTHEQLDRLRVQSPIKPLAIAFAEGPPR